MILFSALRLIAFRTMGKREFKLNRLHNKQYIGRPPAEFWMVNFVIRLVKFLLLTRVVN